MNTERYAFDGVRARAAASRPQHLQPTHAVARRLDHRGLRGRPALYVVPAAQTDDDAMTDLLLSKSDFAVNENAFACDVDDAMVSMMVANTMGGAFSI